MSHLSASFVGVTASVIGSTLLPFITIFVLKERLNLKLPLFDIFPPGLKKIHLTLLPVLCCKILSLEMWPTIYDPAQPVIG